MEINTNQNKVATNIVAQERTVGSEDKAATNIVAQERTAGSEDKATKKDSVQGLQSLYSNVKSEKIAGKSWSQEELFAHQEKSNINRMVMSTLMDAKKLDNDVLGKVMNGNTDSITKLISAGGRVAKGIRY